MRADADGTRVRRGLATLASVVCAVLLLASPAAAAPSDAAHDAAVRALEHAKDLRHGAGVRTGRELTPALAELAQHRKDLGAQGRREADALFARPTGTESSPGHSYSVAEATPDCDTHFCIHYVTTTLDAPAATDTDANGVPDYVDDMLSAFESEVFPCENSTTATACGGGTKAGHNWPQAPSDGTLGGDSKFDVYIENLFPAGVFGYVSPDTNNDFNTDSWHSYLVLDKDFSRYSTTISGPNEMRVTAAHEYNHVLQFGIDAWEDTWMFESTAVYFENEVYPTIDDYVASYMGTWATTTADALTDPDGGSGLRIYGSAVWNHWLDHQFGPATILQAWQAKERSEDASGFESFAPGSYGVAINTASAGDGFAKEFDDFSAAVAEWRAPGSPFPDIYPDVQRRDAIIVNGGAKNEFLDHTTFELLDLGTTTFPTLRLAATLPAGLNGAIALVGRTGGSPDAGVVTSAITKLPTGGSGTVTLEHANTFGRITAVLVNADTRTTGLKPSTFEWQYTSDNERFSGVKVFPGPVVTTGIADAIGGSSATLHGTLNPENLATGYHFEYGTTTDYGSSTPSVAGLTGSADQPVAANVTGLQPGTTYHYRLVGTNSDGTSVGDDQTFTTLPPPTVTTGAASGTSAPAAAPSTTGGANATTTPLTLSLTVAKGKLRAILAKGLRVRARCSRDCTVTIQFVISAKLAKKLHVKRVVATARTTARGTSAATVVLRFGKKARRALAKLRVLPAVVKAAAADSSSNHVRLARTVRFRR